MIPAAIERNYPKRLLEAGWWHMSLFQRPASLGSSIARVAPIRLGSLYH